MTAQELAQLIAAEIVAQGEEIDDLGDGESICLMDTVPTINLTQLAEKILNALGETK